jgi:hypothetical protein
MKFLESLENTLAKWYKGTPDLPKNGQKGLVKYLPWITLVIGLLELWSAWLLWHWAHVANSLVNYANTLSQLYGGTTVTLQKMSAGIWIGVILLFIEAILLLLAVPGLRSQRKSGWDLIFYVSIVNVVYGVVIALTNYGGAFNLVENLILSAIGLYFLFQIREYYKSDSRKSAS